MDLREKYSKLINLALKSDISDLSITEKNNVLYISGTASPSVKHQLWGIYNEIDPDMRAGDLVLNIEEDNSRKDNSTEDNSEEETYEIKSGDSLSKIAQRYKGVTWQQIYEANKDKIKDPNKIFPGQTIKIPK